MPKPRGRLNDNSQNTLCRGGASYGCAKIIEYSRDGDGNIIHDKGEERVLHPHEPVKPIDCRHCGTYMGCKLCAERPRELVCRRCQDWATKAALQTHGKIVRDKAKIDEAWKLVDMRANARIPYLLALKQQESPQARQAYLEAAKQADDEIDHLFAHLWNQP